MPISPIITFKAGRCDFDVGSCALVARLVLTSCKENTHKVTPVADPGYIYLYNDEDLLHFCWRRRAASLEDSEMDLIMFPSDGTFTPYQKKATNGRIFVLKFESSPQRHLFWLQSKSQSASGDPAYFGPRDIKIGQVVNDLLKGEQVDMEQAVIEMHAGHSPNDDGDATMEDVEGHGSNSGGGDYREEGEDAREGGADGGRA